MPHGSACACDSARGCAISMRCARWWRRTSASPWCRRSPPGAARDRCRSGYVGLRDCLGQSQACDLLPQPQDAAAAGAPIGRIICARPRSASCITTGDLPVASLPCVRTVDCAIRIRCLRNRRARRTQSARQPAEPLSSFIAASCTRGSPAAMMRPPPCAGLPSQVVTMPPAPVMIGISAAMS